MAAEIKLLHGPAPTPLVFVHKFLEHLDSLHGNDLLGLRRPANPSTSDVGKLRHLYRFMFTLSWQIASYKLRHDVFPINHIYACSDDFWPKEYRKITYIHPYRLLEDLQKVVHHNTDLWRYKREGKPLPGYLLAWDVIGAWGGQTEQWRKEANGLLEEMETTANDRLLAMMRGLGGTPGRSPDQSPQLPIARTYLHPLAASGIRETATSPTW